MALNNFGLTTTSAPVNVTVVLPPPGSLVFASNQNGLTVTIPIVANTVYEGNTAFSFVLSPSGDGSSLGAPASAAVTIVD